jgi:cysteinyl-tRNA synthetase
MRQPILKLFNSESLKIEPFHKKPGETVTLYTCGPTVYNFAHIGNFRTYVFEDLLRRSLEYFGYVVKQAMNLTDVDDKTIKGALAEHKSLNEYTKTFKKAFFEDLKTLNIEPVEIYPEATDHIEEIIALIQTLLDKKIAYQGSDQSIYFSIEKFPKYGRLSHLEKKNLKFGASCRVDSDEYEKDDAFDFVLWKAYDQSRDGNIFWDSPFGKGRPGWHIECSAMAMKHLGKTLDIHVGGIDNMFPHHENEIAQSEACTGCLFAKHWMHSEHLLVDGKKMSKSLGNFYTLRDLLHKGYTGKEVRFALSQVHYRMQLNFSFQALDAAKNALRRINDCIERIKAFTPTAEQSYFDALLNTQIGVFDEAIASDLNMAEALAAVFKVVKDANTAIDENKLSHTDQTGLLNFFKNTDQILGVMDFEKELVIPEAILKAADDRVKAKKEKNYHESDRLRKWIESEGYIVEDTPNGSKVKKA